MKMFIATAIFALTGFQAHASAPVDEALLFTCESAPNVDSALKVFGFGDENGQGAQIAIFLAGELRVEDQGSYDKTTGKYEGQIFDITVSRQGAVSITAKAANPVLSVGQTDSLVCQ
ncbi:hypothetical protein [Bdellovibrio sp. HCB-110]|uniref:hypothetical protein n=1 Tax=Bdellovibrio sp. HCB-110 TaxID=3391182 RepID=UPI0039B44668